MPQVIYLQRGDKLVEMNESLYDSELLLQDLLEQYPNLLAGSQMNSGDPRRWLLVAREAGVPDGENSGDRWSLDHLFLDQAGIPTLVEVKRSTDTRIRREVVGQMLDYAANAVVYWPVEKIRATFESTCTKHDRDPDTILGDFLGEEEDADDFWDTVKSNLQAGRIRLVFVADEIPTELRRIIEFLNVQMERAEVFGVEVKKYEGEGQTTFVPTLLGQTSESEIRKRTEGKTWDEASFFEKLATSESPECVAVARKLFEWGKGNTTRVWFGRGNTKGVFVPIHNHEGRDHQIFVVSTIGRVEIYFYWYATKPPFESREMRMELLNRLNSIPGVDIPESKLGKRPNFPL